MPFRLSKLYLDVLADDGSLAVFYVTRLRWLGLEHRYDAVEWYPAAGPTGVLRASSAVEEVASTGRRCFRFLFPEGEVTLEAAVLDGGWRVPDGTGGRWSWTVEAARTRTSTHASGLSFPCPSGPGYVDRVDVSGLPRRMGLRRMLWGRLHLEGKTVVYNVTTGPGGDRRAHLRVWPDGGAAHDDDVQVEPEVDGTTIRSPFGSWTLVTDRVLHRGAIPDRERFPRLPDRVLARLLGGTMSEQRLLSRVLGPDGDACGRAVHEDVVFGPRSGSRGGSRV